MKRIMLMTVFLVLLLPSCGSKTPVITTQTPTITSGLIGSSVEEVHDLPGKNTSGVVFVSLNGGSCMGVLVTPYYVLTAAHCILTMQVTSPSQIQVYNAPDFTQYVVVAQYFIHPDYINEGFCNGPDVAILLLCNPLPVYRWDGTPWENYRRTLSNKDPYYVFPIGILYGLRNGYNFAQVNIETPLGYAEEGYHTAYNPDHVIVQAGDSGGPLFYTENFVGSGKVAPHYWPGQAGVEEDWEIIGLTACCGAEGNFITFTATSTFKSWADNIIQPGYPNFCRPEYTQLTSTTHSRGQPSCNNMLSVNWTEPTAINRIAGYSYVIVNQDDQLYDLKRSPDEIADLGADVTHFTTTQLAPGTWEFNLRAIDTRGFGARYFSSFWVEIDNCYSINITSPRKDDRYEVGEWVNVLWDPIIYEGNDVSGGYIVDEIQLFEYFGGSNPRLEIVATFVRNEVNIGSSGFVVPEAPTGNMYMVTVHWRRYALGDMFPNLPQVFFGHSDAFFTIISSGN
jgi:hypothetical protein